MSTNNQQNVENILKRLLYALNLDTYQQLADYLGVDNKTLSAWKARNSKKAIAVISTKCRDMNLNWVLTGEGEMNEHAVIAAEDHLGYTPEMSEAIRKILKVVKDNPGREWELYAAILERVEETRKEKK